MKTFYLFALLLVTLLLVSQYIFPFFYDRLRTCPQMQSVSEFDGSVSYDHLQTRPQMQSVSELDGNVSYDHLLTRPQMQSVSDSIGIYVSYNHLQLVQQWPQTFCLTYGKCIKKLPQRFTLHGIWPADRNGTTINANCKASRDLKAVIQCLRKDLHNAWPSIRRDLPEEKFWQHEWDTHGICSLSILESALNYFNVAIDQTNKINVLSYLKDANKSITPSNNKPYSKAAIQEAVREGVKKGVGANITNVYVSCKPHKKDNQRFLLFEIYICLNAKGTEFISCPTDNAKRGCRGEANQDNIIFPATSTLKD